MKIVITVNAAWNIWNFRRPLVEALLADGHAVTILAPADDSVPDLTALGCRFVHLNMRPKGLNPLSDLALIRRFRRQFRAERPDAVLGFTIKNNLYGALAARALGVPFLPNVTGLGTAFQSAGPLQAAVRQLYRRAFRDVPVAFFQNRDDCDLFLSQGLVRPDQTRVLPGSGIDLRRFAGADLPQAGDATVFLMIARLLREKGVAEYAAAARSVRARWPGARFRLLGAHDPRDRAAVGAGELAEWIRGGDIEYLGTVPDVRPAIAAAHCVVLPSFYREGAPRALIEAAAMARPLIATDIPGCRDVVDHGRTGLVCAPRDVAGLADACEAFLRLDPDERTAMGRAGRAKIAAEFDVALVIGAYREALAGLDPRPRDAATKSSPPRE